jgi:peptide/nickel transport system permease protein
MLALIVLIVVIGPLLWTSDPRVQDLTATMADPSAAHPLGTDENGRDVLSRLLHGGRVSLSIAVVTVLISTLIAGSIGLVAGFLRGRVDNIVMRSTDVILSVPFLLLAMSLAVALGPGFRTTVIVLTIASVPYDARVIRSVVLSVRERDFVFAASASGVRPSRIMLRHVLGNSLSPILVTSGVNVGFVLLAGAGLGFLGLGVQPPEPEWGSMLGNARAYITSRPIIVVAPGLAIFATALACNIVADALRDAFDPSQ